MKVRSVKRIEGFRSGVVSFEAGQTLRGRVISRVRKGRFRVSAAGQVFEADSDLPLDVGQRLVAKVEVEGTRIRLRVQDDYRDGNRSEEKEDPEEIRRILKALGVKPDPLDLLEFQERLERYRPHSGLVGLPPSDVWVLALLWARRIRGGAEAFAICSYYLRECSLASSDTVTTPNPEVLFHYLSQAPKEETSTEYPENLEAPSDTEESPLTTPPFRTEKAIHWLNRQSSAAGRYLVLEPPEGTAYLMQPADDSIQSVRWVDNPSAPLFVLEANKMGGKAKTRVHFIERPMEVASPDWENWHLAWREYLGEAEVDLVDFQAVSVDYTDDLLPLFWRRWEGDNLYHKRV